MDAGMVFPRLPGIHNALEHALEIFLREILQEHIELIGFMPQNHIAFPQGILQAELKLFCSILQAVRKFLSRIFLGQDEQEFDDRSPISLVELPKKMIDKGELLEVHGDHPIAPMPPLHNLRDAGKLLLDIIFAG